MKTDSPKHPWFTFYASASLFSCVLSVLLVAASPAPRTHHPDMSVPILMYHHVGDWGAANADWAPYVVKPQEFQRQLNWLAAHQFHAITFQELLAYQSSNARRFKVAYGDDINVFAARMAQHAQK